MQMVSVNGSLLLATIMFSCSSGGLCRVLGVEEAPLLGSPVRLSPGSALCVSPRGPAPAVCAYSSLIPADMTADSTQEPVVFHGTPSGEFAVECLPRLLPVNSIPWHTFGGLS